MASQFMTVSKRSGAMMVGDFTPTTTGWWFTGPSTSHGRIKHAIETRRIRKHQRRKAYMKALRN